MTRIGLSFAIGLGLFAIAREAEAVVTKPLPGITLVRETNRALVVVDLCAPGVSVRTTSYADRRKTPQAWAEKVGADVAINADFYEFPNASYVLGRARSLGVDWPLGTQFYEYTNFGEVRSYWQLGNGFTELVNPSTTAPSPQAFEVLGAHNIIIKGGVPSFDGDAVLVSAHRRTGIGVDAARAHLYLFTANDAITGAQMSASMIALAAQAGAPPIDVASNEDGGGSSQMYVKGLGQIVTSGREVANHLGVFAKGSGPAPMCPNRAPVGYLDAVTCDVMEGWAYDSDEPQKAIDVHFYFDGPAGEGGVNAFGIGGAALHRADLCAAIGSCAHGFSTPTPFGLFDGKPHSVHPYAIDTKGNGPNPLLGTAPKSVTCQPGLPPLRRRLLAGNAASAWKIDPFRDTMPVTDAMLAKLGDGPSITEAPVVAKADKGTPELWLIELGKKRKIPSAAVVAWHFDPNAAKMVPASLLESLPAGPALGARPLVAANGASRWLIDAEDGTSTTSPDGSGCNCNVDGGVEDGSRADAGSRRTPGDVGGDPNASTGDTNSGCRASRSPLDAKELFAIGLAAATLLVHRRRR